MARKRIHFDERKFVRHYLSGRQTIAELARQFGFSESFAHKIICGDRRPEIAEAIDRGRHAQIRRLRTSLTDLGDDVIRLLRKAMGGEPTAGAIAAARAVLRHALPPERPRGPKLLPEVYYTSSPLPGEEDDEDDDMRDDYPPDAPPLLDGAATPPTDRYARGLTRQDGLP